MSSWRSGHLAPLHSALSSKPSAGFIISGSGQRKFSLNVLMCCLDQVRPLSPGEIVCPLGKLILPHRNCVLGSVQKHRGDKPKQLPRASPTLSFAIFARNLSLRAVKKQNLKRPRKK